MMDEYQFSFWYETLWIIDWGLNDPETYNFGPGQVPMEYMAGQLATDTGVFDEQAGTLTVTLRDDVYFQEGAPYNGRQFVAEGQLSIRKKGFPPLSPRGRSCSKEKNCAVAMSFSVLSHWG